MKRNLYSIIFSLLVFIFSAGCKKENDKQPQCRITHLLKNGSQTYDFTYGDNGKLSSVLYMPANETSSYSYDGNITTITVTKNGNFKYRMIVTNNPGGFATNVLIENNQSGDDWFNQEFTYEGNKVISNKAKDSGGDSAIANYIWEDGNPSTLLGDGDVFHYEYYTDKDFRIGDWRNIQQLIAGYRIYEYRNLFQSSGINGNTTYYTYKFDDAGRIEEATATSANTSITYKLEYECK